MSAPVVTFALSAMSAKAAIDGLRDGNLMKAVVGAVGAYAGFSGLANLGTAASEAAVAGSATNSAVGNLGSAASDASIAGGVTEGVVGATGTGASELGLSSIANSGGQQAAANAAMPAATESSGILSSVGSWAEKNPKLSSSLVQIGGGMLQGSAQEDMLKEAWDREKKLAAQARARRGYSASTGILGKQKFNPASGQWEAIK